MEDLSIDIEATDDNSTIEVVEIYDILLRDGTHLRYATVQVDSEFLDVSI